MFSRKTLLVLLSCCVLPLLLGQVCIPQQDPTDPETLARFDEVCNTFDQKYSYFVHKEVDWQEMRELYRPLFEYYLTPAEFAEELNDMLQVLRDWHVNVFPPEGDALGYEGTYETNYPPTPIADYTVGGAGYESLGGGVIRHALVGENIAHIRIDSLDTDAFSAITDNMIGNLFVQYQNAAGMIIDIRANNGGNENNAIRFASRLTDATVTYGYTETRNGPDHDDFDPPVAKQLTPSDRLHYDGPVVGLIGQRCLSSAEWFTLMLRASGATLIGDDTRGGSGNPETFSLSNGVEYRLSRWVAWTADADGEMESIFEDMGITPDIYVPPGEGAGKSYTATRDYVLERALEYLSD